MKNKLLVMILLFVGLSAHGQNFVTVSSTKTQDSSGVLLAAGQACFQPVSSGGVPIAYKAGGDGPTTKTPVCATIATGAWSLSIANTALTSPVNVCFNVTIKDTAKNQYVLGSIGYDASKPSGYQCVQPQANTPDFWCLTGTCNFDKYTPNLAPLALTSAGPQGLPGSSCTNGSSVAAWSSVTAYSVGQCATYLTGLWYAVQAGTNQEPAVDSSYWARVSYTDNNLTYLNPRSATDVCTQANNLLAVGATHLILPPKPGGGCYSSSVSCNMSVANTLFSFAGGACITSAAAGNPFNISAAGVTVLNPDIRPSGAPGVRVGLKVNALSYYFSVVGGSIGPATDNGTDMFFDCFAAEQSYYGKVYGLDAHGCSNAGFHLTNNANANHLNSVSARGANTEQKYQKYGVLVDDAVGCTNAGSVVAWSAVTAYVGSTSNGQCATSIGSTWRALQNNTNQTPADGSAYWTRSNNTDSVKVDCLACEGNTISNVEIEGADGTEISGHLEAIGCKWNSTTHACVNLTGTVTFTNGSAAVTGVGTLFTTEVLVGQAIKDSGVLEVPKYYARVCAIASDTALTLCHPYQGPLSGPTHVGNLTQLNFYIGVNSKTYSGENCASGQTSCAIGNMLKNPTLGGSQASPLGIWDQGSFGTVGVFGDLKQPLYIDTNSLSGHLFAGANTGTMLNLSTSTFAQVGQTVNRMVITPNFTSGLSAFLISLPSGWVTSTAALDIRDSAGNVIMQVFPSGLTYLPALSGGSGTIQASPVGNGNMKFAGPVSSLLFTDNMSLGNSANPWKGVATTGLFATNLLLSSTSPTISSGFGTSPSISAANGTASFVVNVGTGGSASSGVVGLPAATTGWNCRALNITATAANRANQWTVQTASTTTTVTVQNQTISTGAALAWTASDLVRMSCFAY